MNIFKPCVVSLMLWTGVMGVFGQQALAAEFFQKINASNTSTFTPIAIALPEVTTKLPEVTTKLKSKQDTRVVHGLIITNNDAAPATVFFEKNSHQKTGNIIVPPHSTLHIPLSSGIGFVVGDTLDAELKGSSTASVDLTIDYKDL